MDYVGAAVIVVLFVVLLKLLRLPENSLEVIHISRTALAVVRNPELTDEDKEKQVQRHAIRLVKSFVIVTISAILALGTPLGLVWLLDYASLVSFDNVLNITLSTWFLVVSTLVIVGFFWITTRKQ